MASRHLPRVLYQCCFEDILDALPFAVFIKDGQSRLTWGNQKFTDISGLPHIADLNIQVLPGLSEEHDRIARQTDMVVLRDQTIQSYEHHMATADGRKLDVRVMKIPAKTAKDEVVGIIGVVADTTTDRETVRTLLKTLARLENQKENLERYASDLQTSLVFTEEQAANMVELAEQIEVQRQNIEEQNRQIRQLMHTDENTGLHNRRYLYDVAEEVLRGRDHLVDRGVCAMLDIDNFKCINDEFGHDGGDQALRAFASTVKEILPHLSVLCRFGGEEFVVVTPPMPVSYGIRLMDKIRKAVAETVCLYDGRAICMTVSIGVTAIEAGMTLSDLLQNADRAMYQAKDMGRDRTVVYQPPCLRAAKA